MAERKICQDCDHGGIILEGRNIIIKFKGAIVIVDQYYCQNCNTHFLTSPGDEMQNEFAFSEDELFFLLFEWHDEGKIIITNMDELE
jgi:hypothetical protein